MVERLGARADDRRAACHADAVVVAPPQVGRIEEPEGAGVLDHRRALDQVPLPGLRRPDEPVRRADGREPVGRELLGVDLGGQVAAVPVALPQQPWRAVGCHEHAGVDGAATCDGTHEGGRGVIDEGAGGVGAGGVRDAHRAGLPSGGLEAPERRCLGATSERDGRRCRVVHDVGAVRSGPHRRRPLEPGHRPRRQRGQRIPEILPVEPRIGASSMTGTCAAAAYCVVSVFEA